MKYVKYPKYLLIYLNVGSLNSSKLSITTDDQSYNYWNDFVVERSH